MTLYYLPNPWMRHEVPSQHSSVEIFGSFTQPKWKVFLRCEYCARSGRWVFEGDWKTFAGEAFQFKFRINGYQIATSALHFQCTDAQGNYNNIVSPFSSSLVTPCLTTQEKITSLKQSITHQINALKTLISKQITEERSGFGYWDRADM